MEHAVAPPPDTLAESFAGSAGTPVQQQPLDVAPVDPNNFSAKFNDVTFIVGQPDPTQPVVDLNSNSINTPNPVSDSITNVGLNIEAVSPNTSSLIGDIFSAGSNILDNVAEVSAYVSGGSQLNNTTQPAQQITASIEGGEPIKVQPGVQPVNPDYQNNYASPALTPSSGMNA